MFRDENVWPCVRAAKSKYGRRTASLAQGGKVRAQRDASRKRNLLSSTFITFVNLSVRASSTQNIVKDVKQAKSRI